MEQLLQQTEAGSAERGIDCVEIYLPKKLAHLSELYNFLRSCVTDRYGLLVLDGFSIYEVDGFFRGIEGKPWEERSLVIRILFMRTVAADPSQLQARVRELGREIANKIAVSEEEVWICNFAQNVTIFRPNSKIIV